MGIPRVIGGVTLGVGGAVALYDVLSGGAVRRRVHDVWDLRHRAWFVVSHPTKLWLADAAVGAHRRAEAAQRRMFGAAPHYDNELDAFRHAYASALMTVDLMHRRRLDPADARRLTERAGASFEADGHNTPAASRMDLHNNAQGAALVSDGRRADGGWLSEQDVRRAVEQHLRSGGLVRLGPRGDVVPTDGREFSRYLLPQSAGAAR